MFEVFLSVVFFSLSFLHYNELSETIRMSDPEILHDIVGGCHLASITSVTQGIS